MKTILTTTKKITLQQHLRSWYNLPSAEWQQLSIFFFYQNIHSSMQTLETKHQTSPYHNLIFKSLNFLKQNKILCFLDLTIELIFDTQTIFTIQIWTGRINHESDKAKCLWPPKKKGAYKGQKQGKRGLQNMKWRH